MPGSKLSRQHFISLNLITSWQEVCKVRFSTKFSDRKRMGNQHKIRHSRQLYQSAVNSSSELADLLKMNIIVIFYKKHLYMLQKMLSFAPNSMIITPLAKRRAKNPFQKFLIFSCNSVIGEFVYVHECGARFAVSERFGNDR